MSKYSDWIDYPYTIITLLQDNAYNLNVDFFLLQESTNSNVRDTWTYHVEGMTNSGNMS